MLIEEGNKAIRLKCGVVLREADGQSVLTGSGRRAAYYRLNEVGTTCLRLLLDGSPLESASTAVAEQYGVGADDVRADIDVLIDNLRSAELIKVQRR